jgi:hypothetical protein
MNAIWCGARQRFLSSSSYGCEWWCGLALHPVEDDANVLWVAEVESEHGDVGAAVQQAEDVGDRDCAGEGADEGSADADSGNVEHPAANC